MFPDQMFGGGMSYPGGPMSYGMFGAPQKKKKKGIGFNPLMMISPLGGLFAESPRAAMSLMSPLLSGAFK